jgi:hypothetical protein
MSHAELEKWKWATLAAIAMTLLSLYPQFLMWSTRGREWNGSYAQLHGDEWFYSAYIQALIDGRPRRNDPFTGRDDAPGNAQPESLFSIQFVPAYLIATPARLVGVSASTAFIVLGILAPLFSCFALFSLIQNLTHDHRLAAAGAIVVLCFGALAAGEGAIHLVSSSVQYAFLPFLRRYEPGAVFPLFFAFCTLVWKSLKAQRQTLAWAFAAGVILDALIFSYFYLWTSAVAWLACLALLWFIAYIKDSRKYAVPFITILLLAVVALIPYALLLSRRSTSMDSGQKLTLSHAPDLLRMPEVLGIAVIALITWSAVRGKINWRAPEILFAASFALMPLAVFNQQVITGRSLQPFHYESFIANYVTLVGAFVTIVTIRRSANNPGSIRSPRLANRLVVVALLWACLEVVVIPRAFIKKDSQFIDRVAAVGERLRVLSKAEPANGNVGPDPRPLVLATDNRVSMMLPTFAPQAIFWAPNFDLLNLRVGESRERFYQFLYYSGVDTEQFQKELRQPMGNIAAAAFGHERVLPDLAVHASPITNEDIASEVGHYQSYLSSFTRVQAIHHPVSYVIVPVDGNVNLSNLDQWYERDSGETIGDYRLYRVRLRS